MVVMIDVVAYEHNIEVWLLYGLAMLYEMPTHANMQGNRGLRAEGQTLRTSDGREPSRSPGDINSCFQNSVQYINF